MRGWASVDASTSLNLAHRHSVAASDLAHRQSLDMAELTGMAGSRRVSRLLAAALTARDSVTGAPLCMPACGCACACMLMCVYVHAAWCTCMCMVHVRAFRNQFICFGKIIYFMKKGRPVIYRRVVYKTHSSFRKYVQKVMFDNLGNVIMFDVVFPPRTMFTPKDMYVCLCIILLTLVC